MEQAQQPELTINDLKNLKSVLEAAIRRSAFEPSEIAGVGNVYNKLDKFLSHIESQTPAQETQG